MPEFFHLISGFERYVKCGFISLSYRSEGLYYSLIGYFKYLVLCKENCTSLSSYWGIMFERSMLVEPFVLFCFSFKTKVMEFQNTIGLTSIPRSARLCILASLNLLKLRNCVWINFLSPEKGRLFKQGWWGFKFMFEIFCYDAIQTDCNCHTILFSEYVNFHFFFVIDLLQYVLPIYAYKHTVGSE